MKKKTSKAQKNVRKKRKKKKYKKKNMKKQKKTYGVGPTPFRVLLIIEFCAISFNNYEVNDEICDVNQ